MSRRTLVAVVLGLVGALTLTGCTGSTPKPTTPFTEYAPEDRALAPAAVGELLAGAGSLALADHRGEVVVVNFWASWCPPCRAEAADLEAAYQSTKANKVTFVGVNIRDDRDKALAFERGRMTYPSVFDPAGKMALAFEVPPTAIPTTVVIDRSGRIAAIARSAVLKADLIAVLDRVAGESL